MNRKFLIALALAVTFAALPAFGANVMIKGSALSGISDIVKAATGNDLKIEKHSLFLVERVYDAGSIRLRDRVFAINNDGSLKKQYGSEYYGIGSAFINKSAIAPKQQIIQKIGIAPSDKKFQHGSTSDKRNIFVTSPGCTDGSSIYGVTSVASR